jgi:prepilin-type N-terminal cleavage/methylation domain-containing protein
METTMFSQIRNKLNSKGFSMVELMAVTGIVSVLASVAIPQFNSYRVKAYNSAALSDLKNVQTILEAYYEDNNSYPQ